MTAAPGPTASIRGPAEGAGEASLAAAVAPGVLDAALGAGLVLVTAATLVPALRPVSAALGWVALVVALGPTDCGAPLASPGLLALGCAGAVAVLALARPPAASVATLLMVFPAAALAALAVSRLLPSIGLAGPPASVIAAALAGALLPALAVGPRGQTPLALALALMGAVAVLPAAVAASGCVPVALPWPAVALPLSAGLGLALLQRLRMGHRAPIGKRGRIW